MDCVARVVDHPKPGETVMGKDLNYFPGGKGANQAVAAARMGAKTVMLGKVGNDGFADFMKEFLDGESIDTQHIGVEACATGTAFIAVNENGENTIIVIPGANAEVKAEQLDVLKIKENDILICQNEVPSNEILQCFKKHKGSGGVVIYNPAPAIDVPAELFDLADFVIVNEGEAC